jgi:inosine-uridine nucleoside N-ribohydrolase
MKLLRRFGVLPFFVLVALVAAGQQVPAPRVAAAEPQLAILDTDIGDDIDDAFALALLLQSREVKLLGITTAYGDTDLRARLADRYLGAVCRFDINVIPGVPTPQQNHFSQAAYADGLANPACAMMGGGPARLLSKDEQARLAKQRKKDAAKWEADQARVMAGVAHLVQQRAAHDATGFLLEQIQAHPGEITLIAIGPLNNIQAAIEKDPATFRKLKRVVMMGGSIYRGYDGAQGERRAPDAEWNISRDPAGLRALLASGVPVYMMPLDSTQIHLQTADRERIFAHGSPLTDQLTLLYHQWLANKGDASPTPTLFDPVAAAFAVHPELCPMTPMRLEVDDKGMTLPVAGQPNAQVCLQSDEKGFLDLLLGRLTAQP